PVRARQAPADHRPLARVRHPGRRPECLAPPCRNPARGCSLLGNRPRLHERDRRERAPAPAREARGRRPAHGRHLRAGVRPGEAVIVGAVAVETALLILKIVFLVLLYLFIWRIVRSVAKDLRLPQESFVLAPEGGLAARASGPSTGRLVVLKSPALDEGADL